MTALRAAGLRQLCVVLCCVIGGLPALAAAPAVAAGGGRLPAIIGSAGHASEVLQPVTRSGREIYAGFRSGLADPECAVDASDRWRRHFSHVPRELAERPRQLLPLFGYVVEALREYHLPTEYALIPFVESGYRPGARSPSGPAGLWQFIAATARNHHVPVGPTYDGRLSPLDSTAAAVRYLRTLHGMFAGDWRLAVMGYNAGEYRIFGALRKAGQQAMDADPDGLAVPGITRAYVRKLQALSCLLVEAGEQEEWLEAIDHRVPVLTPEPLPPHVRQLDRWAARNGYDPALVRHFNPVFRDGRVARAGRDRQVLVPARPKHALAALLPDAPAPGAQGRSRDGGDEVVFLADATGLLEGEGAMSGPAPHTHTVKPGESAWRIARRHGISVAQLLAGNGLERDSVLQPGMVLQIGDPDAGDSPHVAH